MRNIGSICILVCFVVFVMWPSVALAGLTPLGGEFQINTTTAGSQGSFSVATDDAGNFVSAWTSPVSQFCDAQDIFFHLFDSNGNKVGGEVTVAEYMDEDQRSPNVAMDADGDFVIVWEEGGLLFCADPPCDCTGHEPDGGESGIYAQRYFSDGSLNGAPFQVNTTWQQWQEDPVVVMNTQGDFVVVWIDNAGNDGWGRGVYAQLFDSAGNMVGSEQLVNQTTDGHQWEFDVSINDNREYIVVWRGDDSDSYGVFARRFGSDGNPIENEWVVNLVETGTQWNPSVVLFNDGSFIITWNVLDNDGDVYFQRFSSSGIRLGSETLAHPSTTGPQRSPHIQGNKNNNVFLIIWLFNDSDPYGVQGQLYSSNGVPDTFITRINSTEIGSQTGIDLAFSVSNKVTISWISDDGDFGGGFGQRYQVTQQAWVPMVSGPMLVLFAILLMAVLVWVMRKRGVVEKSSAT